MAAAKHTIKDRVLSLWSCCSQFEIVCYDSYREVSVVVAFFVKVVVVTNKTESGGWTYEKIFRTIVLSEAPAVPGLHTKSGVTHTINFACNEMRTGLKRMFLFDAFFIIGIHGAECQTKRVDFDHVLGVGSRKGHKKYDDQNGQKFCRFPEWVMA